MSPRKKKNDPPLKYLWRNYWRPTPIFIRRIADTLLITFGSSSFSASYFGHDQRAANIMAWIAIGSKLISNFFAEEGKK